MARRRRRNLIWLIVATLLLGGAAAIGALGGNTERVTRMWAYAEIAKDGSARVTEVIDYDFGSGIQPRHGIFRDIPGLSILDEVAKVRSTMDGRPVPYDLTIDDSWEGHRIQIGDPGETVSGVHRYRVQYTLNDEVDDARLVRDGKLAWDAIGTGWKVDLDNVEVHVVSPYDLTGTRCVRGSTGSHQSCKATEPEPGHLVVDLGRLVPGHGATLYASRTGGALAADKAAAPAPPSAAPLTAERNTGPLAAGLLAAAIALFAVLVTARVLRLLGRDRLAADGEERRVEIDRLAASLTPSPTPPEDLSPAEGGILLAERVEPRHKVAWLLTAVADGHVTIDGPERYPTLKRREDETDGTDEGSEDSEGDARLLDPITSDVLDEMFAGRDEFTLGLYDPRFTTAWRTLGSRLDRWQRTGDLWDPAAERRIPSVQMTGAACVLLGLIAAIVGGVFTAGTSAAWLPLLTIGAVTAGTGLALCTRSWELPSRTARGTALWLQVEAFRRHLAESGPADTTDAEQLERHTAWAVALGETDHLPAAVTASTTSPSGNTTRHRRSRLERYGPAMAVGLIAATAISGTAPSSSGGSGSSGGDSGGGGVGGGEGGGGGGSW